MNRDPIERAIHSAAMVLVGRAASREEVDAAMTVALDAMPAQDPDQLREAALRVAAQRKESMLAEVSNLEAAGHRRDAVMIIARRHSDPGDARAVDSLARKLRRWRTKN